MISSMSPPSLVKVSITSCLSRSIVAMMASTSSGVCLSFNVPAIESYAFSIFFPSASQNSFPSFGPSERPLPPFSFSSAAAASSCAFSSSSCALSALNSGWSSKRAFPALISHTLSNTFFGTIRSSISFSAHWMKSRTSGLGRNAAAPLSRSSSWSSGTMPSTMPATRPSPSMVGPPHKPSGRGRSVSARSRSGEAKMRCPGSEKGKKVRSSSSPPPPLPFFFGASLPSTALSSATSNPSNRIFSPRWKWLSSSRRCIISTPRSCMCFRAVSSFLMCMIARSIPVGWCIGYGFNPNLAKASAPSPPGVRSASSESNTSREYAQCSNSIALSQSWG
mmetsp:Transcript_20325/g.58761  ORF Transcript_20325/g.58761 Transcript_20325/m.58761 type:complete len:335 (-) Transcript_20325:479-1483(-)